LQLTWSSDRNSCNDASKNKDNHPGKVKGVTVNYCVRLALGAGKEESEEASGKSDNASAK